MVPIKGLPTKPLPIQGEAMSLPLQGEATRGEPISPELKGITAAKAEVRAKMTKRATI